MSTVKDLAPWEIPPDEAYWQALLNEGEYVAEPSLQGLSTPTPQDTMPAAPVEEATEGKTAPTEDDAPRWNTFQSYYTDGEPIDLPVVSYNRGGLLVNWDGVLGFVPASHLCENLSTGDEQARLEALEGQVGSMLTLKIIELDPAQNRLILSERAAKRTVGLDAHILDELQPGNVCHGKVTNVCSFGAFVDLGGVEGLIHISELSWGRVSHPADVLHSGKEVDVYVLNVDRERGRIGLSVKRLYPDPWDTVETRYDVGQVIAGTVTNLVNFGAFVRVEEGLEGLIHSSEWEDIGLSAPVREGDAVQVRVVSLDKSRHRMGLTLQNPGDDHQTPPLV